jgi:hypothetical protein
LENRRDLGRRDARTVAVRPSEVTLVERYRAGGLEALPGGLHLEELERDPEWVADADTSTKNDRPHSSRSSRRHALGAAEAAA